MTKDRSATLIAEAKAMRYSRRTVLQRASAMGLSAAAVAGVLGATGHEAAAAPNKAPAFLQGGSLNILQSSPFVPAVEPFMEEQVAAFGKENNVDVTLDFISWPDLQPRVTSAIQAGAGPDIVEMWPTIPYLYGENLVNVDDLAATLGEAQGGYFDWVQKTVQVDGEWRSIPHGTSSIAVIYRKSYFEQAGVADPENNFPKTWQEYFEVGKALKEMGKPLGQSLGQSLGDPPGFCYPYMWSYGAKEVEEDGKTVAYDTESFNEGLELFIQGWKDAFDETGLGWDDGTNNSAYLSDQLSATLNGSSIYLAATDKDGENYNPELAEDSFHAPLPSGPDGQFAALGSRSQGILSYTENEDAAKAFLEWWFQPEQYQSWLEAFKGYIIPPGDEFIDLPVFTEDPKLAPFVEIVNIGRNKGYAGPANLASAQAAAQYIVVNTFANAVTSGDAATAIDQAAAQLKRIYGRSR